LPLQFDSKPDDPYESDSDDVDESLTVPVPGEDVRVSTYYETFVGLISRRMIRSSNTRTSSGECVVQSALRYPDICFLAKKGKAMTSA